MAAADILAFPFLRPLPVTFSMLPVLLWFLLHLRRIQRTRENFAIGIFLFLAFISFSFSLITLPSKAVGQGILGEVLAQNVAYLYLLVLLFSYYLLFFTAIKSWSFDPVLLIRLYYCFNFVLVLLFWVDFQSYFSVRSLWTFSSDISAADELSSIVRFTGIFSDPNNAATASVALYCYLYLYDRASSMRTALYTVMCLVVIVATMSNTGILAFISALGVILLSGGGHGSAGRGAKGFIVAAVFVLGALLAFYFLSATEIGKIAIDRFFDNSADSRLEKFSQLIGLNVVEYLFWGDGGTIYLDSEVFRPHVGHLHLIYNYGMIAYFCFIFSVFRLRRTARLIDYLPILPIFLGFSANTGFIDFRFTAVAALLFAVYASKASLSRQNVEENKFSLNSLGKLKSRRYNEVEQ